MTDEERLADIEQRVEDLMVNVVGTRIIGGIYWLIDRVRALAAERDDLIVERDKWKTRVTG